MGEVSNAVYFSTLLRLWILLYYEISDSATCSAVCQINDVRDDIKALHNVPLICARCCIAGTN